VNVPEKVTVAFSFMEFELRETFETTGATVTLTVKADCFTPPSSSVTVAIPLYVPEAAYVRTAVHEPLPLVSLAAGEESGDESPHVIRHVCVSLVPASVKFTLTVAALPRSTVFVVATLLIRTLVILGMTLFTVTLVLA
jgi:hypothetical protein